MKKSAVILILFLFAGGTAVSVSAQTKARDVITMLQKRYELLNDFTADLLEVQISGFSGAVDSTRLTIALLKQDYFKIESFDLTLVTDGTTVTDYSKHEKRATVDDFENSHNSVLPRDFLFEFPERYVPSDFEREQQYGSRGFRLSLEPRNPDEEIMQTLEVWVDASDSLVKFVRYTDFNDNEYRYALSNYRIDTGLTPGDFALNLPEGVKIVDLRRKRND